MKQLIFIFIFKLLLLLNLYDHINNMIEDKYFMIIEIKNNA